jgi:hypothetical protein
MYATTRTIGESIMEWSSTWEINNAKGMLHPNMYNELRGAAFERRYGSVAPGTFFVNTYEISEGQFIDADYLSTTGDLFSNGIWEFATNLDLTGNPVRGYENRTSEGEDPPTVWNIVDMLSDIGDAERFSERNSLVASDYAFQLYNVLNNCRTSIRKTIFPFLTVSVLSEAVESEFVVDEAIWDFYTGDITIGGILRTVGNSYNFWNNDTTKFVGRSLADRYTGHAKELTVNILALPASGQAYSIGHYDGVNGFQYKNW